MPKELLGKMEVNLGMTIQFTNKLNKELTKYQDTIKFCLK
jgi:hypothetical protein